MEEVFIDIDTCCEFHKHFTSVSYGRSESLFIYDCCTKLERLFLRQFLPVQRGGWVRTLYLRINSQMLYRCATLFTGRAYFYNRNLRA
jgi:hypothetical protein